MQVYCYAYYYSMPSSSFDFGSAIPCVELAVQSLGETYQGDDGKYYQTDIIGDRDGEILGGGVGNFDGLRSIGFSDLTGVTIVDYTGTSIPTINGNVIEFTTGVMYYLELSDGSKYYFNAGEGSIVFDISDNENHGTLITGSDVGFQTFELGIYSYLDNYGYNKFIGAYLPAKESDKSIDVFGTALSVKGRVKYPSELHSGTYTTDSISNYTSTGYYAKSGTVFILKGRFVSFNNINNLQGSVDSTTGRRFYFGEILSNGFFTFGVGSTSLLTTVPVTTNHHIYIMYMSDASSSFYVLPIDTKIETSDDILDIINNTTPDATNEAFSGTSTVQLQLGNAFLRDNTVASFFCNFEHIETIIGETDGALWDEKMRIKHSSDYNIIENTTDVVSKLEWDGSQINARTLSPYACPRNNTKGFNVDVDGLYIGASETDPTKDLLGDDLQTFGTEKGLNGSESQYLSPYAYELIQACNSLSPNFIFENESPILWGYDDIESNVQGLDFMFADVNTNTPVKFNTTTYSESLTGECLIKSYEYFNIDAVFITDEDGNLLIDDDGNFIIE